MSFHESPAGVMLHLPARLKTLNGWLSHWTAYIHDEPHDLYGPLRRAHHLDQGNPSAGLMMRALLIMGRSIDYGHGSREPCESPALFIHRVTGRIAISGKAGNFKKQRQAVRASTPAKFSSVPHRPPTHIIDGATFCCGAIRLRVLGLDASADQFEKALGKMPRLVLLAAALLLASCGSSKTDVLTEADIHQASAPNKDVDRLDPELEPDAPPPSPEVSVAPLAMPVPMDRPDFDLPVMEEAKPRTIGKATATRDLDSEAIDWAPISVPSPEETVEPVAVAQDPLHPSSPVQNDDGN